MSNRIDFFQSAQTQLALPAATTSILVDGQLCPWLELIEIVRSGWPAFGRAQLSYNPAAHPKAKSTVAEEIETILAIGQTVCARQVYNGTAPGASACSFPIFVGQIEGIKTNLTSDGETVEIVARDFSANLEHITVYGQWVSNSDGTILFLPGADTVFNEDGKANATSSPIDHNGGSITLFAAEPSTGSHWSCAEVISYLFHEYLPAGQLQTPNIRQLESLTQNHRIRDLDVTGLNLLEALQRCCERMSLEFKFVPRSVPTGPNQAIVFYKSGIGRTVELNCQQGSEQFSISKTNIVALNSRKNFWPVTHRYIGQGDFKLYEATFELVKAWDPNGEDSDYDKFSPSTNPDFYQVKDVYRKWCLNEAGYYNGAPYNQGEAFDFSEIFQSDNFVRRRRRFRPALTADKQGKSLGYFVEVSYDDGVTWQQYLHAFNNLLDECGVWLSSNQLDVEAWTAALDDVLKFRITASVIGDERLSCVITDGPIDSVVPVVDHIITVPRQFKYRKVSNQSIFANLSDECLGKPNEVDDSAALFEFVRQKAQVSSEVIETINVKTPFLAFDFQVGDIVTSSPESRDLLGARSDNRSIRCVEQVQMDFQKQQTNLKIIRKRIWQL